MLDQDTPSGTQTAQGWVLNTYSDFAAADEADRDHWIRATPIERMEALEYIRALNYGYADENQPRPRLQRLYRTAELRNG